MPDQANDLRKLVRKCGPTASLASSSRRIVVFGGKGGVGTTTVSVNLAVALSRQNTRTVLVDAAGSDAAIACRIDPRYTLADVLSGARTLSESLRSGPERLQVLAGSRMATSGIDDSPHAWDRLLADLAALAPSPGAIVLDGGSHPDRSARRLWQAADLLLLVTTPQTASVVDAYASIKLMAESARATPIHLLVNMASRPEMAEDVYFRLAEACRRFLALSLRNAGDVPTDARLLEPTAVGHDAGGPFGHLAQRVMAEDASAAPNAA